MIQPTLPWLLRATAFATLAAVACSQNLLVNPGFESGLQDWQVLTGSAVDVAYGSTLVPPVQVGAVVGGQNRMLRQAGGATATVEQVVVTGPIAPGTNVDVSGLFGGFASEADSSRMLLRFLSVSGAELGIRDLRTVTQENRNRETVLMLRQARFAIPSGTEAIAAVVELTNSSSSTSTAVADEISISLTTDPIVPPPLPVDTNLVTNGDFEAGWTLDSPLTIATVLGWEGAGSTTQARSYSNIDDTVPAAVVSAIIGGGGRMLQDGSSNGRLRQQFDLRGNAPLIDGGIDMVVSAYLGGVGSEPDSAAVEVFFYDSFMVPVGLTTDPVGPVSLTERNRETVLVKREQRYRVPVGTAFMVLQINLENVSSSTSLALVDNVEARLMSPIAPAVQPLDVNVVRNGSFEMGSLSGSPLQLNDPDSWRGSGVGAVDVLLYGSGSQAPGTAFSFANGLGGALLQDGTGNAALTQNFDVRGMGDLIAQGSFMVSARTWLGGVASEADTATGRIRFLTEFGVQIGLERILGPVTALDRMNLTTLLERSDVYVVPLGTAEVELEVRFENVSSSTSLGSADGVELVFSDGNAFGTNYCQANPNSTGTSATIRATGSDLVSMNDTTLAASGLPPGAFSFFIASVTQGFVQNPGGSDGNLCISGAIGRYVGPGQIQQASTIGDIGLGIDLTAIPSPNGPVSVNVGDTWNFQAWYRDVGPSGPSSNFTDGVSVLFR